MLEAKLARRFGEQNRAVGCICKHEQVQPRENDDEHLTLYGEYSSVFPTLHMKKVRSNHSQGHMTKAFLVVSALRH